MNQIQTNYTIPKSVIKEVNMVMKNLNLIKIIVPENDNVSKNDMIWMSLLNPNMNLLIIESMCIGIVMTDYMANNFGYIRSIKNYDTPLKYKKFSIKIVIIDSNWDIYNWNNVNLERFYYSMADNIIGKQLEEIKNFDSWKVETIDIKFLEALSWNPLV